jgi:Protein of unknown function (DUF1091)
LKLEYFQGFRFILHSIQYTSNPVHISNLTINVFNDSLGDSRFNSSGILNRDVQRVKITAILRVKSTGSRNYDKTFLQGDVDLCKIKKGAIGNFVVGIVMEHLKEYSNIIIECPFKKGFYYTTNFPINPTNMNTLFPQYLLPFVKSEPWELTIIFKGKFQKAKSFEHVFSYKFYGQTL